MDYQVIETSDDLVAFNEWSMKTDPKVTTPVLSKLYFQTIKYGNNSLYLWIGDTNTKLENISCAMKTPYAEQPVNTQLLFANNESSLMSNDLAVKLAKRLNKQVFVSVNCAFASIYDADSQELFLKTVELALSKEIKTYPNKF